MSLDLMGILRQVNYWLSEVIATLSETIDLITSYCTYLQLTQETWGIQSPFVTVAHLDYGQWPLTMKLDQGPKLCVWREGIILSHSSMRPDALLRPSKKAWNLEVRNLYVDWRVHFLVDLISELVSNISSPFNWTYIIWDEWTTNLQRVKFSTWITVNWKVSLNATIPSRPRMRSKWWPKQTHDTNNTMPYI